MMSLGRVVLGVVLFFGLVGVGDVGNLFAQGSESEPVEVPSTGGTDAAAEEDSSDAEQQTDIEELERRVEVLAEEVERLRSGEQTEVDLDLLRHSMTGSLLAGLVELYDASETEREPLDIDTSTRSFTFAGETTSLRPEQLEHPVTGR